MTESNQSTCQSAGATPASEPSNVPVHLEIVDRLRTFTLVRQALLLANDNYQKLKTNNRLASATLGQIESLAGSLALPMINTFEKQIHMADTMACQSFDRLQSSVTAVSETIGLEKMQKRVLDTVDYVQANMKQVSNLIDQSIGQTRSIIEMLRKQTSQHVHSMMNVSETFIRSVDHSLNAAENLLDRLLPVGVESGGQPECQEQHREEQPVGGDNDPQQPLRHLFQRMIRFSDKLRRRSWQHLERKYLVQIQQHVQNVRQNTWHMASIISMARGDQQQEQQQAPSQQQQQEQQQQPRTADESKQL